jgi:MFS family permease
MHPGRTGILIIVVIAQFACVSLWFAGNGVLNDLISTFNLKETVLGNLTSAIQLGFIAGTLFYAIYSIADRISPSTVFFVSAILASGSNLLTIVSNGDQVLLYGSRFLTGFFLAGIYPVGMKIAADYYDKDLGKALGYLLAALVLGTAFPHLLKSVLHNLPWAHVLVTASLLAFVGGCLVFFLVPDGPFRKRGTGFNPAVIMNVFKQNNFRAVASGYFGHMWELYTFWAFVPFILKNVLSEDTTGDNSLLTFFIIGLGSLACIAGGYLAQTIGSYRVAFMALAMSGTCCLLSPLFFTFNPVLVFVFLLFWGMVVIADSPQFSTLVAQFAPVENKASALTIVNCIGFTITILSIQLVSVLSNFISYQWLFIFLFPGPALGLIALYKMQKRNEQVST